LTKNFEDTIASDSTKGPIIEKKKETKKYVSLKKNGSKAISQETLTNLAQRRITGKKARCTVNES